MTCLVEPDDERIAALLAEDRIGNLGLAGDLAVSEPGGIDLFLDDPDEPSGLLAVGWWVRIYARDPAALDRLRPAIPEREGRSRTTSSSSSSSSSKGSSSESPVAAWTVAASG